jgi:hypothetical protein
VLLDVKDFRRLPPRLFLSPVNEKPALDFHVLVQVIPPLSQCLPWARWWRFVGRQQIAHLR